MNDSNRVIRKLETDEDRNLLIGLLSSQKFGVLSSYDGINPQANIITYAFTSDISHLIFATPRNTQKYENLSRIPRAAILVHNSINSREDIGRAHAVTAEGVVTELFEDRLEYMRSLFLLRHPYLDNFGNSQDNAFFSLKVLRFVLVSRFQDVTEFTL